MPGGALVVDLSATKAVTVDPQTRVVSGPSGSMVPARSEAREATVTIPHAEVPQHGRAGREPRESSPSRRWSVRDWSSGQRIRATGAPSWCGSLRRPGRSRQPRAPPKAVGPPDRLWFARAPEVTLLEGVTRVPRYAENVAEVLLNGLSLSNWSSAASAQSPAPEPTSWPLAVKVTSMFPRVAFE
jgi:hypothetical protein